MYLLASDIPGNDVASPYISGAKGASPSRPRAGGRICVSMSSEAMFLETLKVPEVEVGARGKDIVFDEIGAVTGVDEALAVVVSCLGRKSLCRRTSNASTLSPKRTSTL